jgi:hypothetical protein
MAIQLKSGFTPTAPWGGLVPMTAGGAAYNRQVEKRMNTKNNREIVLGMASPFEMMSGELLILLAFSAG